MIDALKLPAERIRVIYEAEGDEYQPVTAPTTLAKARARYGLNERYILYIGGLDQRKNVPQLVRAFAYLSRQMHDPGLQLLIAGNPDKQSGPLFPDPRPVAADLGRSEEHTSELQSHLNLVCRLLLEKKKIVGRIARSSTCL